MKRWGRQVSALRSSFFPPSAHFKLKRDHLMLLSIIKNLMDLLFSVDCA